MNWEEVQVRTGQEIHKRGDLLLYRLGVRQGAIPFEGGAAGKAGNFFFAPAEIPERAELLRRYLPDETAEILRDADAICGHRFRLLGYENLDFGAPGTNIDWHLDPVHDKRAPQEPWFKIPFLDFATVGDHKITWELNRHQHLVRLAKAFVLSGDDKYARELMAQWRSWIEANPYPLGINWGSTLEVAFRSLSWIWVDQLLAASSAGPYAAFRAELAPALAFHGRYIARYLSTYFSPNTHLLGEALALFFLGILYPQMRGAAQWQQAGWQVLLSEAKRQVRPDGVYFEQSLHYHVYALDFFLYARLLALRNGMEIPADFDAILKRMLDVVAALAQSGTAEGFGDDDGGRLWNPLRNRTEHMTDPLALGAVSYGTAFAGSRLTEEAIWLFGKPAIEQLLATIAATSAVRSTAFRDGGLYVIADSEPYAQAMVVDGGPQGIGRCGHGHADALSVRLTMNGHRWLVDSGSGVYIAKDPADRNTFRGTGAHNTMRVDGLDQAVADQPFSWMNIPEVKAESWIAGKSFVYFAGSHNGYARLADPVVHRRHVLKIAGGPWLVRDLASGKTEHELEVLWHFAPDVDVQMAGAGRIRASRFGAVSGEPELSLIVPEGSAWQAGMRITRSLVSPVYGALQPAPLVRCGARLGLPAEVATALIPQVIDRDGKSAGENGMEESAVPKLAAMAQASVQVYELDYHEQSHGFFFARGSEAWSFGPWSSDAAVVYCRVENERLAQLVAIGGTNVAWQGKPLLASSKVREFFEWRRAVPAEIAGRTSEAISNDSLGEISITPWFEELIGGMHGSSGMNHGSSSYAEKH